MTPHSSAASSTAVEPRADRGALPRRVWVWQAVGFLILGALALVASTSAPPDAWWLHGLWCFAGLTVATPALVRALRLDFSIVFTDHRVIFLAAFSLYFLFGAILLAVGPELQIRAAQLPYPIDAIDALRVDGINGLGLGVALLTSAVSRGAWLGSQASWAAIRLSRVPALWVAAPLLAVGVAATLYILPVDLGMRQGLVPGIVRMLGNLSIVAVFLATSSRGRGETVLRGIGLVLALGLAAMGALQFSKTGMLLPLAAAVAGLALRFGALKVLPVGLTLLVSLFLISGNMVTYGRYAVVRSGAALTLADRLALVPEAWDNTRDLPDEREYSSWARLCYVPAQGASLHFYDQGDGGDGLRLMGWVFVPRAIAPQKPEMTATGRELNRKIAGVDTSYAGLGAFTTGYYHGGWWGVLLASLLCGWIIAQTSAIARAVITHDAILMAPFPLLGMYMAFRIDGDFVTDYLAVFVMFLYPMLAIAAWRLLTTPGRRTAAGSR